MKVGIFLKKTSEDPYLAGANNASTAKMKKYLFFLFFAAVLLSCHKERPALADGGPGPAVSPHVEPTGLEMRIDGSIQDIRLFRLRKANGASRMRLLVDLPDSAHFSLFVTHFAVGSHQIETGNVADDVLKFSRTHCEFEQQVDESQFYLYEVDTALAFDNRVEITQIDTVQRTVSGRFRCHLKKEIFISVPNPERMLVEGDFYAAYRD